MSGHLIHIGYPKAASTTLQAWFEQHPQLEYVPNGLGGYYGAHEIANASVTLGTGRPAWRVTSAEALSVPNLATGLDPWLRIMAEDSPAAFAARQTHVCQTLRSLFPEATILIVTRGFRATMASGFSQYVRSGGVLGFEEATAAVQAEMTFQYDELVDLYADAFGQDRVIVLPFELLRDDPRAFVTILEQRLGVDHIDLPPTLNPSLLPSELYWYPRISRVTAWVLARLTRRYFNQAYGRYAALTFQNRLRRPIALLQRLFPHRRTDVDDVPRQIVERCRGRASKLGQRPLYEPYAAEYLNDPR
jgi:hypothetical protein